MKKTDLLVKMLMGDIENKTVLEVACGAADFSISASAYSNSVYCIDLDAGRISGSLPEQVHFQIMDAAKMEYADSTFDTIILYNAFSHVQSQWPGIERECKRVLKADGLLYVVGTWKLDTGFMAEVFGCNAKWRGEFLIAEIRR